MGGEPRRCNCDAPLPLRSIIDVKAAPASHGAGQWWPPCSLSSSVRGQIEVPPRARRMGGDLERRLRLALGPPFKFKLFLSVTVQVAQPEAVPVYYYQQSQTQWLPPVLSERVIHIF